MPTDLFALAAALARGFVPAPVVRRAVEAVAGRPPAETPETCWFCSTDPADGPFYPYCSSQCAIDANVGR